MDFLINPNVSYVLLIIGFLTMVFALFSPGTGFLEIGALIALALAGYGIINLPLNGWAVAIMALGFIPFLIALWQFRRKENRLRLPLLIVSTLAFVAGSALLFRGEGWRPAVHPILIVLISPLAIGMTWLMATKMVEVLTSRPVFDLDRLTGMTGEASSDIQGEGSVYVNGENWTARSPVFIPAGSTVRVVGREGLVLLVERVK